MYMPFGKYRGVQLEHIPEDYLLWVLDTCSNISQTLRHAIKQRLGLAAPPRPSSAPGLAEVLKKWYWQLALTYHPDRGGSVEAMQAINEANDRLRKMLGLPS